MLIVALVFDNIYSTMANTNKNGAALPRASVEQVTPEKAAQVLSGPNVNVRHLNEEYAQQLAKLMALGRWDVNGESVKFNASGELVDGQHRMRACVISGKAFTTLVVRDVDNDANVDVGRHRSAAQLLARDGATRPTLVASALRLLVPWEAGVRDRRLLSQCKDVPNAEVQKLYDVHPNMQSSCESAWLSQIPGGYPSLQAFIHYLGARATDQETADAFLSGFVLSEQEKGDPRRAFMQRIGGVRGKLERWHYLTGLVRVWNAWVRGEKLMYLQATRGLTDPNGRLLEPLCQEIAGRKAVAK